MDLIVGNLEFLLLLPASYIYFHFNSQGTVLIKSAAELKAFSPGAEDLLDSVSVGYYYCHLKLFNMVAFQNNSDFQRAVYVQ